MGESNDKGTPLIEHNLTLHNQGWQVLPTGQFCPVKTVVLTGRVKPVLPGFYPGFNRVLAGWSKLVLPMGKTWAKPVSLIGYREEVLRENNAFLTG